MSTLREDAMAMMNDAIQTVLPDAAVIRALEHKTFGGRVVVVALGKAAWNMANAAKIVLGRSIYRGIVITKYAHSKGCIEGFEIIEAGHPVPDKNSVSGAERALEMVADLTSEDTVVLLLSGGGSALFEKPLEGVTLKEIMDITSQLLRSGAGIIEINTVRKHLSAVKGGRFASHCGDAGIFTVVLSDVLGDRLDTIASGPAYPDASTSEEAIEIIRRYGVNVRESIFHALMLETPKILTRCETVVTGSVTQLCEAAAQSAANLGYQPLILTSTLDGEASEAGKFMAALAREASQDKIHSYGMKKPWALIVGGETIVHLKGKGKGGRNQELALSAALGMEGLKDTLLMAVGSDGTDGPTDAAGGMVDGKTTERIRQSGFKPEQMLEDNDAYNALRASGDLIITGPTGTNVNDVAILLCR